VTDVQILEHRFVEAVPSQLEAGILYVSLEYTTMIHLCCCGCGNEVVTPLNPKDWKMTFDGKAVSVHPSVGNWSLPCRSHYVIRHGRVNWAGDWTDEQIARGRARDQIRKSEEREFESERQEVGQRRLTVPTSLWQKLVKWFSS